MNSDGLAILIWRGTRSAELLKTWPGRSTHERLPAHTGTFMGTPEFHAKVQKIKDAAIECDGELVVHNEAGQTYWVGVREDGRVEVVKEGEGWETKARVYLNLSSAIIMERM